MSRNGRTSLDELRRKDFSVRMRGLDHNEVRGFLNALTDELEPIYAQLTTAIRENDQLRSRLAQVDVNPEEQVTEYAVALLTQAQQLADGLIDEAVESARDLMSTARTQQLEIVSQASSAANGAAGPATALAGRDPGLDVEYIRMFAGVAQTQFLAVLDALKEQVNRLGEVPEVAELQDRPNQRQVS